MKKENQSVRELEIGKDYVNVHDNDVVVIDRVGGIMNRGFERRKYKNDLACSFSPNWREATEEEVVKAFEKHLIHRYGEDWRTMKIKERHPNSNGGINGGSYEMHILKLRHNGWVVYNQNGMLYCNGIWVERLEEKELEKIHIKDAIKENAVIYCETIGEAERILGMAHVCGYKWFTGEGYKNNTKWEDYKEKICYNIFDGLCGDVKHYESNKQIIPSTQIADLEKKTTDWTPAPADIEVMNKKASEKRPIDKVTTRNLDIALRMVGIQLDISIIDKVIDLVELIENKGDDVSIKDVVSLQQTWSRHSQAFH